MVFSTSAMKIAAGRKRTKQLLPLEMVSILRYFHCYGGFSRGVRSPKTIMRISALEHMVSFRIRCWNVNGHFLASLSLSPSPNPLTFGTPLRTHITTYYAHPCSLFCCSTDFRAHFSLILHSTLILSDIRNGIPHEWGWAMVFSSSTFSSMRRVEQQKIPTLTELIPFPSWYSVP